MDKALINYKVERRWYQRKRYIILSIIALASVLDIATRTFVRNIDYRLNSPQEDRSWHSQSSGLAPHPSNHPESVIQVYGARTWGLKGALAVHTWIAIKKYDEKEYSVSQVIGWRQARSGTALFMDKMVPDKSWYGHQPNLLLDLRGKEANPLIIKVEDAIKQYPYANDYTLWPGPNSNTFISWIGMEVPELGLDLPSTAIGKDWRPINRAIGRSSSGTGLQASFLGILGASIGYEEGLELNFLGLSFEIDLFDLAIELPGYGRIGV